jgi:hypothetical protein
MRSMRSLSLTLFAICILPGAALAQTSAAPATTPPTAADAPATKADDLKPICVDQDPGPASRLQSRRVCHTRQEWNRLGGVPR